MTRLSLILPTYNEATNITQVLDELLTVLDLEQDEIIVVDDNSPDGTANLVEEYCFEKDLDEIQVLRRVGKERGLSLAVVDGFSVAEGKYLGVMDADMSHDAQILPKLIAALDGGHVFAIGSRRVPGGGAVHWPLVRRMASNVATAFTKSLLLLPVKDPMSGYFVMRREMFERSVSKLHPRGYKILLELLMCSREKNVVEIPYVFKDRRQGYSKISVPVLSSFLQQCLSLSWARLRRG